MRGDETIMVHISVCVGGGFEKTSMEVFFHKSDKIYMVTHVKVCSSTS